MIVKGIPTRSDTINFSNFLTKMTMYPLIIPNNYQRDYTWSRRPKRKGSKSALEIFLKDFFDALEKGPEYKLIFGNNVCIASDDGSRIMHLSDGQQRITTLFLFGIILANNNPEYLKMFFLSKTDQQDQLKLKHSVPLWNQYFINSILNIENEEDSYLQSILLARVQILNFIQKKKDENKFDPEEWFDFLLYNVYVNVQTIELDAEQQYFADINTKGVVLDSIDLIKSTILNLHKESNLDELWQSMIYSVDRFSTVFANTGTHTLLETVMSWGLYVLDINSTMEVSNVGKAISKIEDPERFISIVKHIADIGYMLRTDPKYTLLKYLNSGNYIPFYYKLVILQNLSEKKVFNFLLYSFIISDFKNGQAIKEFSKVVSSGDISIKYSPELFDEIYYKKGPNKKIRTILCIIESYFHSDILYSDISSQTCTIEHISSQQFKEEEYNSLGNLTFLSKSDNSKLNKKQEKYPIYRNSEFEITKSLCIDYIPNNDEFRMFRSKYLPGYNSQSIDSFNKDDFKLRQRNIYNALIEILNLKCHD